MPPSIKERGRPNLPQLVFQPNKVKVKRNFAALAVCTHQRSRKACIIHLMYKLQLMYLVMCYDSICSYSLMVCQQTSYEWCIGWQVNRWNRSWMQTRKDTRFCSRWKSLYLFGSSTFFHALMLGYLWKQFWRIKQSRSYGHANPAIMISIANSPLYVMHAWGGTTLDVLDSVHTL